MTYSDLLKQRNDLDQQLKALRPETIQSFKERVLAEAKELEINIEELFKPGRAAPKDKYGDDKGNRWTGLGRTPLWLQAHIAEGKSRDDFAL